MFLLFRGVRDPEERPVVVEAPCGNPFPCEILPHLEEVREQVGDTCEFLNHDLAYHRAGDGGARSMLQALQRAMRVHMRAGHESPGYRGIRQRRAWRSRQKSQ